MEFYFTYVANIDTLFNPLLKMAIQAECEPYTIYVQILIGCNLQGFLVNWPSAKFSCSKLYW